jgi:hypothetical protein
MKYKLSHAWPVGGVVIPAGSLIDDDAESGWSTVASGLVPPPDSVPLDKATRDWLVSIYSSMPDHRWEIAAVPTA